MGKEPRVEDVDLVWRLILGMVSMETLGWSVVNHLESRLKLSPGSVFPGRVSGLPCAHTLDYPGPRPLIPPVSF